MRTTRQGASIDAALRSVEGFRTAQDLHAVLRERGEAVGLTTVYRHLNALAESGQIDAVHRPDGELQYRLCDASAGEHHHHLVCRVCGKAEEVAGPEVEAWADAIARKAGYTDVTHTLEIFGLCPEHSG